MIDSGVENLLIARIWNVLSDPKKAHKNQNLSLNAANLLPNNKTYFSYEQIFQYNARPLQQLNGRLVKFQRDNTSLK